MEVISPNSLRIPDREDRVWLEYVSVPPSRDVITSKTFIVDYEPQSYKDCPVKSVNQYETEEKKDPCPELALRPVAMYRDPFRQGRHKIVLCELDYYDDRVFDKKIDRYLCYHCKRRKYKTCTLTDIFKYFVEFHGLVAGETRHKCRKLLEQVAEEEPWFGFEQTYFFVDENDVPYDWDLAIKDPNHDLTDDYFKTGQVGKQRRLTDLHMRACVYAGLDMYGMNREWSPSQWEYQLGPVCGIDAPDQLMVSRFILVKLAEMHGLVVNFFNLECMKGTIARSMLHMNFSTKKMREEGGLKHIEAAIENMSHHDQEKILRFYDLAPGNNYKWRLDGSPYTPAWDKFVCRVGDKMDAIVRIPTHVAIAKKGYFEDRRPSGEADPYDVCRVLAASALLKAYDF